MLTRTQLLDKLETGATPESVPRCPICHREDRELVVWTTYEEHWVDSQVLRCHQCAPPSTLSSYAKPVPYNPDIHAHVFGFAQHRVELKHAIKSYEPGATMTIGQCFECECLFDATKGYGKEDVHEYPQPIQSIQFCQDCYRRRRRRGMEISYGRYKNRLTRDDLMTLQYHMDVYYRARALKFEQLLNQPV